MRAPRFGRLALLVLAPFLLSGCQLLFPYMYGSGSTDILEPSFGPDISYVRGTASLDIVQGTSTQHVVLDELVGGSGVMEGMSEATWRNSDGWSMSIFDFAMPEMPVGADSSQITLQRVHDNQVWVVDTFTSENACSTSVSEASDTRFAGSSSCRQLRWADGSVAPGGFGLAAPSYIAGQDPFSATITFEATP